MAADTPIEKLEDHDLIKKVGEQFFGRTVAGGKVTWVRTMARTLKISQTHFISLADGSSRLTAKNRLKLLEWAAAETIKEQEARLQRRALLREVKRRFK